MNRRSFFGKIIAFAAACVGIKAAPLDGLNPQAKTMPQDEWMGKIILLGPPVNDGLWLMSSVNDPKDYGVNFWIIPAENVPGEVAMHLVCKERRTMGVLTMGD